MRLQKHKQVKKSVSVRKVALYLLYLIGILALDLKIYEGYSAEIAYMRSVSIHATFSVEVEQAKIPLCNNALSSNRLPLSFHFRTSFSNPFSFQTAFFTTYTAFNLVYIDFIKYKDFQHHLILYCASLKRYINYCKLSL